MILEPDYWVREEEDVLVSRDLKGQDARGQYRSPLQLCTSNDCMLAAERLRADVKQQLLLSAASLALTPGRGSSQPSTLRDCTSNVKKQAVQDSTADLFSFAAREGLAMSCRRR